MEQHQSFLRKEFIARLNEEIAASPQKCLFLLMSLAHENPGFRGNTDENRWTSQDSWNLGSRGRIDEPELSESRISKEQESRYGSIFDDLIKQFNYVTEAILSQRVEFIRKARNPFHTQIRQVLHEDDADNCIMVHTLYELAKKINHGKHEPLFPVRSAYGDRESGDSYHKFEPSVSRYLASRDALSESDLAREMRNLLMGASLTDEALGFLPCLTASWFISETARNPLTSMTSLILLDMLENNIVFNAGKDSSWYCWRNVLIHPEKGISAEGIEVGEVKDLYGRSVNIDDFGGCHPMAHRGSVAQSKEPVTPGMSLNITRQKEVHLIVHWLALSINANKHKYGIQRDVIPKRAAKDKAKTKTIEELSEEKEQKEKQLEKLQGTIRVKQSTNKDANVDKEKDAIKELNKDIANVNNQLQKKSNIRASIIEPLLMLRASHVENLLTPTTTFSIYSPKEDLQLSPLKDSEDRFVNDDGEEEKTSLLPSPVNFNYAKEYKDDKSKSQIVIFFPQIQYAVKPELETTDALSELKNSLHQGLGELIKIYKDDFEILSANNFEIIIRVNAAIRNEALAGLMVHYSTKMRAPIELNDESYTELLVDIIEQIRSQQITKENIGKKELNNDILDKDSKLTRCMVLIDVLGDEKSTKLTPKGKNFYDCLDKAIKKITSALQIGDKPLAVDKQALRQQIRGLNLNQKHELLTRLNYLYKQSKDELNKMLNLIPEVLIERAFNESRNRFEKFCINRNIEKNQAIILKSLFSEVIEKNSNGKSSQVVKEEFLKAVKENKKIEEPAKKIIMEFEGGRIWAILEIYKKNIMAIKRIYLFKIQFPDFNPIVKKIALQKPIDENRKRDIQKEFRQKIQIARQAAKGDRLDAWKQVFLHVEKMTPGFVERALQLPYLGSQYPRVVPLPDRFQKCYYRHFKDLLVQQLLAEARTEGDVWEAERISVDGQHLEAWEVQKLCRILGFSAQVTVWEQAGEHLPFLPEEVALKLPKIHIYLNLREHHFQFVLKRLSEAAEEFINVTGDGNCGIYAVIGAIHAHILQHQMLYREFLVEEWNKKGVICYKEGEYRQATSFFNRALLYSHPDNVSDSTSSASLLGEVGLFSHGVVFDVRGQKINSVADSYEYEDDDLMPGWKRKDGEIGTYK